MSKFLTYEDRLVIAQLLQENVSFGVIGKKLMLAFLRDSNTSASVIQIINLLDKVLGNKNFSQLFPVILTDNGSEFSNPKAIEKRDTIPRNRTNVFYCDPSAPYQKGACEVNHELIRRMHISGKFKETDFESAKVDIENAEEDIESQKADIRNKLLAFSDMISEKTINHTFELFSKCGKEEYFGRTIVEDITGIKSTRASELIKLLVDSKVIVSVTGHGRGKYRFQL